MPRDWKQREREPKRDPYDKVLIVCEGTKTEPNYFNGLKDSLRLNNANVRIAGKGIVPMQIVGFAEEQYTKETGDPFDKVYCVFDKDQHPGYEEAKRKLKQMEPKGTYIPITSVPSFEYWLLLHYKYSTKSCDSQKMMKELKRYMPNYTKGQAGIFEQLQEKLETAKQHAKQSLVDSRKSGSENPSTQVHIPVECLQKLKRP